MKRVLGFVVLGVLAVALAACGTGGEGDNFDTGKLTEIEKNFIIKAVGNLEEFKGYQNLSEAEKNIIVAEGEKSGLTISFDGEKMSAVDEEDRPVHFGEYKECGYAEDLPVPEKGKIQYSVAGEEYFLALYYEYTLEEALEYINSLKSAGFSEIIYENGGLQLAFSANNGDEKNVSAVFSDGVLIIELSPF